MPVLHLVLSGDLSWLFWSLWYQTGFYGSSRSWKLKGTGRKKFWHADQARFLFLAKWYDFHMTKRSCLISGCQSYIQGSRRTLKKMLTETTTRSSQTEKKRKKESKNGNGCWKNQTNTSLKYALCLHYALMSSLRCSASTQRQLQHPSLFRSRRLSSELCSFINLWLVQRKVGAVGCGMATFCGRELIFKCKE